MSASIWSISAPRFEFGDDEAFDAVAHVGHLGDEIPQRAAQGLEPVVVVCFGRACLIERALFEQKLDSGFGAQHLDEGEAGEQRDRLGSGLPVIPAAPGRARRG
jgi:hypothetical protein